MSRKIVAAAARSANQIEEMALVIIRAVQPTALRGPEPFDVESFFEFHMEELTGVKPDYRELPNGIHGYTDSDANESIVCSDLMDDPLKERFARSTMAHEAGHAVIHVPEFKLKRAILRSVHDDKHASLRLYRQEEVPLYCNPEWQAWRFAGALLMPEKIFRRAVEMGVSERVLVDTFNVNPAFVRSRAKALKLQVG